jgi:hypothetical protein
MLMLAESENSSCGLGKLDQLPERCMTLDLAPAADYTLELPRSWA